jgi:hypothetical protein
LHTPIEEKYMSPTLPEAPPTRVHSLEDIGHSIVAIAQDILKTACRGEDELHHFFQAIAYHVEENGADLSAAALTAMMRSEMSILDAGGVEEDAGDEDGNYGWGERRSKYKTDTPEESHILKMLLRHRIRVRGVNDTDNDHHYDPEACEPQAEKILCIIDTKLDGNMDAAEQLEMLEKYVPQFRELAELYERVANKQAISVVSSEHDWLADKDVEELVNIKETPVDISAALDRYPMSYKIEKLVWAAQTSGSSELGARLRAFLKAVPAIYFREARETFAELDGLANELPAFEAWLLDRAGFGIFRTDVMAEIERLWSCREIAKGAGRRTFERLEAEGRIARKKQQGKLFFTRSD